MRSEARNYDSYIGNIMSQPQAVSFINTDDGHTKITLIGMLRNNPREELMIHTERIEDLCLTDPDVLVALRNHLSGTGRLSMVLKVPPESFNPIAYLYPDRVKIHITDRSVKCENNKAVSFFVIGSALRIDTGDNIA